MKQPRWRRGLRHLRRWLAALLASALIALAAVMALGQLLLPLVHSHPQAVARLLSRSLGEPVSLASVRGTWQPSGPLFSATHLRIGAGAHALRLPAARLKVNFGAWLHADQRWLELRASGLSAELERGADGRWRMVGMGAHGQGASVPTLGNLPVGVRLHDFTLSLRDAATARTTQVQVAVLRAVAEHGVLRVGADITLAKGAPPIDVRARIDAASGDARLYVAGERLDLKAWLALLHLPTGYLQAAHADHVRVWLGWRGARLANAYGELTLRGATTTASGAQPATSALPVWRGRLEAHRQTDGVWRAALVAADKQSAGNAGGARLNLRWQPATAGRTAQLDVHADALDLATVVPWLAALPQVTPATRHWLLAAAPHGTVASVRLRWRDRQHFHLQAQVRGLGFAAADGRPGVAELGGTLRADAQAFSWQLGGGAATLSVPQVFRKPFVLQRVSGALVGWRDGDGWRVATPGLDLEAKDFALSVVGAVHLPAVGGPVIDVSAVVERAKVAAAKRFWPVNVMSPALVAWLDRGLVDGRVEHGRAVFHGAVDDWPFRNHQGRFEALATVANTTLDYAAHWPPAKALDAQLRFVDVGMEARLTHAQVMHTTVDRASASIADMGSALLKLHVEAHGPSGGMLVALRTIPLSQAWGAALDGLTLKGPAQAGFDLSVPLHTDASPLLDGHVHLDGVAFAAPAWSFALAKLRGDVAFTAHGVAAPSLSATFHNAPVTMQLAIGDRVADAADAIEAGMDGRMDAATLLADYAKLQPLASLSTGAAQFHVGLAVASSAPGASAVSRVTVKSDLRGLALNLPAPLDKPAQATWPLHYVVTLPVVGGTLKLALGSVLQARVQLPGADTPLAADIALGGPAAAPPAKGVVIHGHVDQLDASGWLRRALAASVSGTGVGGGEIAVAARHVKVFGKDFRDLALDLRRSAKGAVITLAGAQVAGTINVPADDLSRRGVTVRLQRLHWPVSAQSAQAPPAPLGVAPAAVPPLHVWVGDLRLGHARLGETRFESYPTATGMHVERLVTHSPDVQINARGDWIGGASDSHTHLVIDFSSADLGRMLDAFGYGGLVVGGATLAHIDGSWPGPPTDFSLANLLGTMKVHVTDGRILNVEPGVGRLFGLFSIRELPRHLSLGFGDLFDSGLSFNTISGDFAFADGNARTDDLTIRGPAALIRVNGRTGLRQHDYDQTISVTPHVGAALPVVGAIAGGPIGAAAGLAVQTLLGKGLGRAAAAHYRVTGSWGKPEIVEVARPAVALTPAPAASIPAPGPAVSNPPPPAPAAPASAPEPTHTARPSSVSPAETHP